MKKSLENDPVEAMKLIKDLNPDFESEIKKGREYKEVLLSTMLRYATFSWYQILKYKSWEYTSRRREEIATKVGSKGDILLYGSKKKGEAAKIFEDFSEGVTILAMMSKGGIEIFGERYDYPMPIEWHRNN